MSFVRVQESGLAYLQGGKAYEKKKGSAKTGYIMKVCESDEIAHWAPKPLDAQPPWTPRGRSLGAQALGRPGTWAPSPLRAQRPRKQPEGRREKKNNHREKPDNHREKPDNHRGKKNNHRGKKKTTRREKKGVQGQRAAGKK